MPPFLLKTNPLFRRQLKANIHLTHFSDVYIEDLPEVPKSSQRAQDSATRKVKLVINTKDVLQYQKQILDLLKYIDSAYERILEKFGALSE